MWLCRLIGHKFKRTDFFAEWVQPTDFCTRCGHHPERAA